MEAAINGHTNIVCELLEDGADRENKNNSKKTAFELAQSMKKHDIAIILDRRKIVDEENGAKAVLIATETGCPNVVSDLLARGAKMDTKNDMGESLFQIAARLPKTRKDEFEEYLEEGNDMEWDMGQMGHDEIEDIRKAAENRSRDLAKIFLSQSLDEHDTTSISNHIFDLMNFVKKVPFDANFLGDKQKFYLNYNPPQKSDPKSRRHKAGSDF